ncbi:hypothetical protein HMPREF9237_01074 [Actinotignum schaalii FB123-CNA-2]|uniref:Uncharacterized protein n=2 Tax=Actinotignum schaalii TaxID=59505 RepID=S2W1K4_9ACTO|nr:hypothetical protein HMPREF9237_01074 [Actinotignum schaalii FB123-CNA-2]
MKCLTTKSGAKSAPKTTVRKDNGGPRGNGANPRSTMERAARPAIRAIPAMPGMTAAEAHGVGIIEKKTGTVTKGTDVVAVVMIAATTVTPGNREIPVAGAMVVPGALRGTVRVNSTMVAANADRRVDSTTDVTVTTIVDTGAIGMTGIRVNRANPEVPGIAAVKAATTGAADGVASGAIIAGARTGDSGSGVMIVIMSVPGAKIVVVPTKTNPVIITTTGAATSMTTSSSLIAVSAGVTTTGRMAGAVMSAVAIATGVTNVVDIAKKIKAGVMTAAAAA